MTATQLSDPRIRFLLEPGIPFVAFGRPRVRPCRIFGGSMLTAPQGQSRR